MDDGSRNEGAESNIQEAGFMPVQRQEEPESSSPNVLQPHTWAPNPPVMGKPLHFGAQETFPGGKICAFTIDDAWLNNLNNLCLSTSCEAVHANPHLLFPTALFSKLVPANNNESLKTLLIKHPDGYSLTDEQTHRVLAFIVNADLQKKEGVAYAPPLCSKNGAKSIVYTITHTTTTSSSPHPPVKIVFGDHAYHPHEISRCACIQQCLAQLLSQNALKENEQVLYQARGLGKLVGVLLTQSAANFLKMTFLQLVEDNRGNAEGIYNLPVEISDTLAAVLGYESSSALGNISLTRLHDGIMGFRNRIDGHKAFLFAATCDEFSESAPRSIGDSTVKLFRIEYDGHDAKSPRIFIDVAGDKPDLVPHCQFQLPYVVPSRDTMASLLSIVNLAMRRADRKSVGCENYSKYLQEQAREKQPSDPSPVAQRNYKLILAHTETRPIPGRRP